MADFGYFGTLLGCTALQVGLRFRNCVARVVFGVVFIVGAVVGDVPDDFFRIVASRRARFG